MVVKPVPCCWFQVPGFVLQVSCFLLVCLLVSGTVLLLLYAVAVCCFPVAGLL